MNLKLWLAVVITALVLTVTTALVELSNHISESLTTLLVAILTSVIAVFVSRRTAGNKKKSKSNVSNAKTLTNSKTPREKGTVKWFSSSKGFGFITRANGEDIFVHFRSILGEGARVLREGMRVEYIVLDGDKGLQAEEVLVLK
jgi:CspA family cold shock protein